MSNLISEDCSSGLHDYCTPCECQCHRNIDDITLDKLVDFIFKNLRDKRWLYWPPGPMAAQVFDKDMCKRELRRFWEAQ